MKVKTDQLTTAINLLHGEWRDILYERLERQIDRAENAVYQIFTDLKEDLIYDIQKAILEETDQVEFLTLDAKNLINVRDRINKITNPSKPIMTVKLTQP